MQKNSKNNLKWIIVGILMFCFAMIVTCLLTQKINILDDYIYKAISKCINPVMTKIVMIITNFANPITIVLIALIVSCIIGINNKDKKTALLFCINLVIMALLNLIFKNIFSRTRPEMINIITESGYSFPSGHSSIAVACYGYLIYILNRIIKNKNIKCVYTIILSILILLIGLSRIYLGVHYASDVLAAFLLSISYLIVYTHLVENISFGKLHKSE